MAISIIADGQRLKLKEGQNLIIEGSKNFVELNFQLSKEWSELDVKANFEQGDKITSVEVENGIVVFPDNIKAGICNLSLTGTGSNSIKATTNYIVFVVEKDIISNIKNT